MKTGLLVAVLAGCGPGEEPNPPPPGGTWGAPITGGNMLLSSREGTAVIADPDRDRLVIMDLERGALVAELALPNDEPGRLIEDAAGRIHVALRRGGALLTLANGRDGAILARRAVCPEPRGLAHDPATDLVHVACTGGELVSLPASGGEAVRALRLDRDLRDVVVTGPNLRVTRFRTAEILTIDAAGNVLNREHPPAVNRLNFNSPEGRTQAVPTVAWRAIGLADGRVLVAHQRAHKGQLGTSPGGYGGGCGGGSIETALTIAGGASTPIAVRPFVAGALPVDVAISADGTQIAIATAGTHLVHTARTSEVLGSRDEDECPPNMGSGFPGDPGFPDEPGFPGGRLEGDGLGAPTSIAYLPDNRLVIFYPEAPALVVRPISGESRVISIPGDFGYDAGRALFHRQTVVGLSCASCHPEGRDDGVVWDFAGLGLRRTQSLGGGILERGPFHWVGDMRDLDQLMNDVFANRMAGGEISDTARASLGPWLNKIPAPAPSVPADTAAVERGAEVFTAAACGTCHNGAQLTNNQLVNVGTGGKFKVPSLLGIANRPPFMHNGCAPTLADRFGTCGGGDLHGVTSTLSQAELQDLVAYLESL